MLRDGLLIDRTAIRVVRYHPLIEIAEQRVGGIQPHVPFNVFGREGRVGLGRCDDDRSGCVPGDRHTFGGEAGGG